MPSKFLQSYETIKTKHNEAFEIVEKAIQNEEEENPSEAIAKYEKGIEIIDEALATPVGLPDDVNTVREEWNLACRMVHKLKRARTEVQQRLGILKEKLNVENQSKLMPLKELIALTIEDGRPRTYTELVQELKSLQDAKLPLNCLELIFSCNGVKLYTIRADGVIPITTFDSTLRIWRLEKDENKHLNNMYFIEVIKTSKTESQRENEQPGVPFPIIMGETSINNFDADFSWIYPLYSEVSPCFLRDHGAFIFPAIQSMEPGTAVGIILPKEGNADEILLEILDSIPHGIVMQMKESEHKVEKDVPTQVSENVIKVAEFTSHNLVKGAEKAGQFLTYVTPYIISKIQGASSDAPVVSSNVQTTVQVARSVTGVAASCASVLARHIAVKTTSLGKFLAPHVHKQGSAFLTKVFGVNADNANKEMAAALIIAASVVEGFGTVYAGLEDTAKILGKNVASNSVKIIDHKYGPSASSLATETFDTVGNIISVSQHASIVQPKGFVKHTAKGTGKAIIRELNPGPEQENEHYIPAGTIFQI